MKGKRVLIHKIEGMHIHESGDRKNKSILFIHGFPFDHSMWEFQTSVLNEHYHCISFDIKGFGKSNLQTGQFTLESFANDIITIVQKLRLKNTVLCGLSMGGYIALRTAEKRPKLFAGLILADTKADADDNNAKLNRANSIITIDKSGLSKFANSMIPNLFSEVTKKKNRAIINHWKLRASKMNPKAIKAAQLAMLSRTDTNDFLKTTDIPLLFLVGEDDKITPPELMGKMNRRAKNSSLCVIKNAGHLSPVENPVAFNNEIINFMKKI